MRASAGRLVKHGQPLQVREVNRPEPAEMRSLSSWPAGGGLNPADMYAARGRVAQDAPVPRTPGTEGDGTPDGRPVVVPGPGMALPVTASGRRAVAPRAALTGVPDGAEPEAAGVVGRPT